MDVTQTGHILGSPVQRTTDPAPERKMSPATTAILRFLIHAAMYQAANTNPQVINNYTESLLLVSQPTGILECSIPGLEKTWKVITRAQKPAANSMIFNILGMQNIL